MATPPATAPKMYRSLAHPDGIPWNSDPPNRTKPRGVFKICRQFQQPLGVSTNPDRPCASIYTHTTIRLRLPARLAKRIKLHTCCLTLSISAVSLMALDWLPNR